MLLKYTRTGFLVFALLFGASGLQLPHFMSNELIQPSHLSVFSAEAFAAPAIFRRRPFESVDSEAHQRIFNLAAREFERSVHVMDSVSILKALEKLEPLADALRDDLYREEFTRYAMPNEVLAQLSIREMAALSGPAAVPRVRRIATLLYRAFLFDFLTLLAAQSIIDRPLWLGKSNMKRVSRLLHHLQSPKSSFVTRLVRHAAQLSNFPGAVLSPNEAKQVTRQQQFIRIFQSRGYPNPHSRGFVHDQARHLRGVVYRATHITGRSGMRRKRDRARTRAANSVDYATMILNLTPLLEYYARYGNRDDVALDIAVGISGDPAVFTNPDILRSINPRNAKRLFDMDGYEKRNNFREGYFYPKHLPAATRDKFFLLVYAIRDRLVEDLNRYYASASEEMSVLFGQQDIYPNVVLTQFWSFLLYSGTCGAGFIYDDLNKLAQDGALSVVRQLLDEEGRRLLAAKTAGAKYIRPMDASLGFTVILETMTRLKDMKLPKKPSGPETLIRRWEKLAA